MGFQADMLAEFDRDFGQGMRRSAEAMVELVQADAAMPRDTGNLAEGIQAKAVTASAGLGSADITSTGKSSDGTDYGHILDTSRGQEIRPVSKRALANTRTGWGPYASSHLTTRHVGWIEKAMSQTNWDQAADRGLGAVGL